MAEKRAKRSKHQRLGAKFRVGGWSYSLLKRMGEVALYEARYPKSEKLQGYVVAIIKKYKGRTLPSGAIVPDREEFPRPSYFGKHGWFFMPTSEAKAWQRFEDLIEESHVGEQGKTCISVPTS